MKIYACYSKNEEIRLKSSSGGVFSLLADAVLTLRGVVYGVAMSRDCYNAEFIRVTDSAGLEKLRGSKYLQAQMGNVFRQVKEDLTEGRYVLFTGTGCQVNGLKCFLEKEYETLFCVDVICHGVPSPELWKKYIRYQESKYGKLVEVDFRCKNFSWNGFEMKENSLFISKEEDAFMQMFLRDYCLRPSCYQCKAKNVKLSDMTMADFWGIERVAPEINDDKGTSLVIVRTIKGKELWEKIVGEMKAKEVTYTDGVRRNPAEYSSAGKPEKRNSFFEDMNSLDFGKLVEKYAVPVNPTLIRKGIRKGKDFLNRIIRNKFRGGNAYWQNYGIKLTFTGGKIRDE